MSRTFERKKQIDIHPIFEQSETGPGEGDTVYYYFWPDGTDYTSFPYPRIQWHTDEKKYLAYAPVQHKKTGDLVYFLSWHDTFSDAERAISMVSESLSGKGDRKLSTVEGKIDSKMEGYRNPDFPDPVTVYVVQVLNWFYGYPPAG
jgi:hypothetical protein